MQKFVYVNIDRFLLNLCDCTDFFLIDKNKLTGDLSFTTMYIMTKSQQIIFSKYSKKYVLYSFVVDVYPVYNQNKFCLI